MAKRTHSDLIDIRSLFKSYISHWYLFAISVVACIILGILFCRVVRTKYGVRANLLIQQEESNPMASLGGLGGLFGSSGYVDDEIFVLSSHSLYREVVRDLGLNRTHYVKTGFLKSDLSYPDYPIDVVPAAGIVDTLKSVVSFKVSINEKGLADIKVKGKYGTIEKVNDVSLPHTFSTNFGEFTVTTTDYYVPGKDVTSTILVTGYHAAAEDIAPEISVEIANKKSNVIEMGYNTPNPVMGEMMLQDIIDKYNERGIREKNLQGQKTAEFIDARLALLGSDLSNAESDIQQFKESHGIIDVRAESQFQMAKRGQLEASLLAAQTNLEILRLTRDFVTNPDNRYEIIPTLVESEALGAVINAYNNLLIERQDMLRTVSEDNPAVIKINASVDAMRSNIIAAANQNYENVQLQVRDLKRQIDNNYGRLSNVPDQERIVLDMQRQLQVKQELYLFLRQKQEENAMLIANAVPKGLIVDAPYTLKEPLGAGTKVILLVFFILGLCLPPVYLYLLKLIRNRVESRSEIERRSSAPIVGEMCTINTDKQLVVSPNDTSTATELFRLMRSNLLFILNGETDKVVLLTSSSSGEGKTFISINLAASLAMLNKKVLIIGMDIRAPKIGSYIGINSKLGLTNYLSQSDVSLDSIINKEPIADIPNLDIILAGPIPPNPAELLASSKVDTLFAEVRKDYDYIIVDSAPVGLVSDTFTLNRIADATIYVTRLNVTSASDIDTIEDIYESGRLKKLSIAINGTKNKKSYGYQNKKGTTTY